MGPHNREYGDTRIQSICRSYKVDLKILITEQFLWKELSSQKLQIYNSELESAE